LANGIDTEKLNCLRKKFLDYIEQLNGIFNSLDTEMYNIESNIDGDGKEEISGKFISIKNQYLPIKSNIQSYIDDFAKVIEGYEIGDMELAKQVINDIVKLEEGSE